MISSETVGTACCVCVCVCVCAGGVVVVSRHGRGGLCGEVAGTSVVDKARGNCQIFRRYLCILTLLFDCYSFSSISNTYCHCLLSIMTTVIVL